MPATFRKTFQWTFHCQERRFKTAGDLPRIQSASGTISLRGNETTVSVVRGKVQVGKLGLLAVGKSSFFMGDYSRKTIDSKMALTLSGPASALAGLTARKPLNFAKKLNLTPSDIGGQARAAITAYFDIDKSIRLAQKAWSAKVKLSKGSTRKLVPGSKISSMNATIDISPSSAKVTGTALVNDVPTKLALVESLDGSGKGSRKITLSLNNKERKRLGSIQVQFSMGPLMSASMIKAMVFGKLKPICAMLNWTFRGLGGAKGRAFQQRRYLT